MSAPRYEDLGVEQDIQILEKTFPGRVETRGSARSADLQERLLAAKPDIVHILVDIVPNSGAGAMSKSSNHTESAHCNKCGV
ncbi:MAG: hypothetical protein ACREYE_14770 [Gammaproteobacteria bacterium]